MHILKKSTLSFITLLIFSLNFQDVISETGDTLEVRTIEFTERRAGWFEFPESDFSAEKIIMDYTLRCPEGRPCGEWDYIANVLVFHYFAPNYSVNSNSPEQYRAMIDTSWNYSAELVDGEVVETQTPKDALWAYFYDHEAGSTVPIDSLRIWPQYFTYTYNENAEKIDSTLVEADTTFTLKKTRVYFDDDITIRERFEIFRYITPYGNGLDLGDGFSWYMDVTDFKELLSGPVYIEAHNGPTWWDELDQTSQEDLRLIFNFIEGTPEREVLNITKLWQGRRNYNPDFELLTPTQNIELTDDEIMARLKIIQSGHGFGADEENCSEFCDKEGKVVVNGDTVYRKSIWRECANNPLYPQGGTWIFDRANWCPGEDVPYHNYELSGFIDGSFTLDYDMQYYDPVITNPNATRGNYVITGYLVTYGEPNFQNDAEILDIIYPTKKQEYLRINPVGNQAAIIIKNRGAETLTNLDIEYGIDGKELTTYQWEGELSFLDTTTVFLPNYERSFDESETNFVVNISNPNDVTDQYPANNSGISEIPALPVYPSEFTIRAIIPNYNILLNQNPYMYNLYDENGDVIFQNMNYAPSTTNSDTLLLEKGNYKLVFENLADFGLGFFAYQGLTRGNLSLFSRDKALRNFGYDFGKSIVHSFLVDDVPQANFTNASSDTISFGEVEIGNGFKTFSLSITPQNDKGLVIEDAVIVFGNTRKFEFVEDREELFAEAIELAAGETYELEIYFEPLSEGELAANLRVQTNDFYDPQKIFRLTGIGVTDVSVEDNNSNSQDFMVVSNPVKNSFKLINNSKEITNFDIKLVDLNGVVLMNLYSGSSFTEKEFDVSNIATGVYFVKIESLNKVSSIKIIKE